MKITLQRTSPNYKQKLSTHRIMRDLAIGLMVIVAYSLYFYYYNYPTNEPLIAAALIYVVSIVVGVDACCIDVYCFFSCCDCN